MVGCGVLEVNFERTALLGFGGVRPQTLPLTVHSEIAHLAPPLAAGSGLAPAAKWFLRGGEFNWRFESLFLVVARGVAFSEWR